MPQKEIRKRAGQKGNAMAETVVMSVVMIPLFFAMATIGKVSDLNQTTIQASRYAAWERTVNTEADKSQTQIATEVKNRFFAQPDLALRSNQGKLTGAQAVNPMWATGSPDDDGKRKSFLGGGNNGNDDGLFVANGMEGDLGRAGIVSETISDIGQTLEGIMPRSEWNMLGNGLYIARIGAQVENVGLLANSAIGQTTKNCAGQEDTEVFQCLIRHNAILIDGWGAASRAQVERRVRTFVPGAILHDVGNALSHLGAIPLIKELEGLKDAFGYVAPDVLPLDRYEER